MFQTREYSVGASYFCQCDEYRFFRCSRVAHVLSHPRSDMTSYRDTLDAIDSARDHAPCGHCQLDDARTDSGSKKTAKVRRRIWIEVSLLY